MTPILTHYKKNHKKGEYRRTHRMRPIKIAIFLLAPRILAAWMNQHARRLQLRQRGTRRPSVAEVHLHLKTQPKDEEN